MNLPDAAKRLGLTDQQMRRSMAKLKAEGLRCHQPGYGCQWRIDPDSVDLVLQQRGEYMPHRQIDLREIV